MSHGVRSQAYEDEEINRLREVKLNKDPFKTGNKHFYNM